MPRKLPEPGQWGNRLRQMEYRVQGVDTWQGVGGDYRRQGELDSGPVRE